MRTGFLLLIVPLLVSCAAQRITLATVGPRPLAWRTGSPSSARGQLQVFTETDSYEYSHDVPYFPHRDYRIYTAQGKYLKRVWNSQSHEDERPATVELPAGQYVVKADAEFYGLVNVPVVIVPGQLTRVILQPGWNPGKEVSVSDLVQMPNGYLVGWRVKTGAQ